MLNPGVGPADVNGNGDLAVVPSFGDWYATAHPVVLAGVVVFVGDVNLAEDATAEGFARALERWDRVSRMASPVGWTYTASVNVVRRHARRRSVERLLLRRTQPPPPADVDREIWSLLRSLPARQREALVLRYVEDLSQAAVAARMQISAGTAAATLNAARSRALGLLSEHGYGPPS